MKHSSKSNLLNGKKWCTNPIYEFSGLILPCQWPNPCVFWWFQKLQSFGYFLLACSSDFQLNIWSRIFNPWMWWRVCCMSIRHPAGFWGYNTFNYWENITQNKGGETDRVLCLSPTSSWPERQRWGAQKLAWEWILVLCFYDALHAREASVPCSHPLAAMFDSISDTHSEHGLSLEKLQCLILSLRSIHAQPGYQQTQCSQGMAVSHQQSYSQQDHAMNQHMDGLEQKLERTQSVKRSASTAHMRFWCALRGFRWKWFPWCCPFRHFATIMLGKVTSTVSET